MRSICGDGQRLHSSGKKIYYIIFLLFPVTVFGGVFFQRTSGRGRNSCNSGSVRQKQQVMLCPLCVCVFRELTFLHTSKVMQTGIEIRRPNPSWLTFQNLLQFYARNLPGLRKKSARLAHALVELSPALPASSSAFGWAGFASCAACFWAPGTLCFALVVLAAGTFGSSL